MDEVRFYLGYRFARVRLKKKRQYDGTGGAPMHFIAYLIDGECELISGEERIRVSAGELFYIPKGQKYRSVWTCGKESGETEYLSFGFLAFPSRRDEKYIMQKLPADGEAAALLSGVRTERRLGADDLARFYGALARLEQLMQKLEKTGEDVAREKVKWYISTHPEAAMAQVARGCLISEPYLYALFKREGKTTPNGYRRETLVNRAVSLLETTDMPVEEISSRLGFSSASYFRKVFFSVCRKTPGAVRKNALKARK